MEMFDDYLLTAIDAVLAVAVLALSVITYWRNRQEQQLRLNPNLHVIGIAYHTSGEEANTYRIWLWNEGLSPLTVECVIDDDTERKLSDEHYKGEKKPLVQPGAAAPWDLWLPSPTRYQKLRICYRNSQGKHSVIADRAEAK